MVILVFFSIGYTQTMGGHVRVELLTRYMGKKTRR